MIHSANSPLAIFAHELREPLASILLAVQSVGEMENSDPVSREVWSIVERQSRYLAGIIDQVLKLEYGSHHEKRLTREWIDCGTTITHAAEAVKSLLIQREHQLTVSLPPDRVCLMADGLRIQQVVINLLANAAKYTEPGGQIDVRLDVVNGLVFLEVHDNGMGISAELLPRMFDLFQQGDRPRGAKVPGLGIGLALVKSLVELHGGSVNAHSDGPGTGATFVVVLPQTGVEAHQPLTGAPGSAKAAGAQSVWAASAMLDA